MLILTGCHVTCESSLLIHVESSGITPWYIGRSLARLFLMTSMFFLFFVPHSLPIDFISIFSCKTIETIGKTVCFLPCHVKKTRVFLWAIIRLRFTEYFTSRFCINDLKTSGKSVKFDRTILVYNLSQIVNFEGLSLLTAFVLYSQSDCLNHSNRDSDWLIVACFMRV